MSGGPRASPSSSSLRPGSPRRRKSLELPDLNTKLSLTATTASGSGSGSTETPVKEDDAAGKMAAMASPRPSAMPIPGAKGVRRWGSASRDRNGKPRAVGQGNTSAPPEKTQHNPYFPAVPEVAASSRIAAALNPVTPGLPDYAHSPGASVQHTEDINAAAAQNMSPEKANMLATMYDLPPDKREAVFKDVRQLDWIQTTCS